MKETLNNPAASFPRTRESIMGSNLDPRVREDDGVVSQITKECHD